MRANHPSPAGSRRPSALPFLLLVSLLAPPGLSGESWPQFGGPHRNFTVETAPAFIPWEADGPKRLWTRELGAGHAGVVGTGETVYGFFRDDQQEVILACNAGTGAVRWRHAYPAPLEGDAAPGEFNTRFGKGPQSTPLLHGGRLYTVGFTGSLRCLDPATGKLLFSRGLLTELAGSFLEYGYAASPLGYEDLVIVQVGGEGRALVALDAGTGAVRWRSGDFGSSYSSPILMRVDGVDHLVVYTACDVVGLSPADGKVHWSIRHGRTDRWGLCTPVALPQGRIFFVNDGFKPSSRLVKLSRHDDVVTPVELWSSREIKGGLFVPVRVGDFMYSQGNGRTSLMVFRIESGKVTWHERGFNRAKLLSNGQQLLILNEEGELMLATPTGRSIDVIARTSILGYPAWAAPSLIGRKLYLRDQESLVALELAVDPGG